MSVSEETMQSIKRTGEAIIKLSEETVSKLTKYSQTGETSTRLLRRQLNSIRYMIDAEIRLISHAPHYASGIKKLQEELKSLDAKKIHETLIRLINIQNELLTNLKSEEYYIGIDGGGTKTKAVVSRKDGKILATACAGPSNPNFSGVEAGCTAIIKSIELAFKKIKISIIDARIIRICAGISGCFKKDIKNAVRNFLVEYFKKNEIPVFDIKIYSDCFAAWYGAFLGQEGIIVISGTGGVVYGRSGDNYTQTWLKQNPTKKEKMLRDGSYSVGIRTGILCRMILKMNKTSVLIDIIRTAFAQGRLWSRHKSHPLQSLMDDIAGAANPQIGKTKILLREEVAELTRYADEAANQGDLAAKKILEESGANAATNVSYLAKLLSITQKPFRLATVGSMFKSYMFSAKMQKELRLLEPLAIVVKPELPPEEGMLALAIKGMNYDESRV